MVTVPVTSVHEIELSSRCNLACRYCPHPKLQRTKGDMSWTTFEQVIDHLRHYCESGTQGEVSLTGLGEAVLHPRFIEMAEIVRSVIGGARSMVMATNGVAITQELATAIARIGIVTYVSTHRPEKAGPAYEMLLKTGVVTGINTSFVDSAFNWAGQLKWHVSADRTACEYLKHGWAVVRQCGHVDACCLDAHDKYPIGSVYDAPGTWATRITPLCESCHMLPPKELLEATIADLAKRENA